MSATRKITIDVPEALALEIEARVATGVAESESAFIVDSVSATLKAEDAEIERWLRDEVVPTYDRWKRENTPPLTSDEVFGGLRERYLARKAAL